MFGMHLGGDGPLTKRTLLLLARGPVREKVCKPAGVRDLRCRVILDHGHDVWMFDVDLYDKWEIRVDS